jgi:glycosyltransferase involved in cell wall biosynthesis
MVSILMPIYNGVYFMQESVSSILAQTQTEWELIVGINGYPALSPVFKAAEAYLCSLNDPRIRLLDFPECKGKAVTLNAMVPLCKYPYVALLDVDDIWLPTKLEVQWPFLKQYDVIGTKCVYFGDLNNIVPAIPAGNLSAFNFLQVNPIINSSCVIKKTLAKWKTDWDGVELDDYELWLRLWRENRTFYNCSEVLVKHRIHKTSAFNAKGNNNQVAALRGLYPLHPPPK